MKKSRLINQPISAVVAGLGHTDTIVVADAGLPIPATAERIDLALMKGVPTFLQILEAVLSEMQVEQVIVASELATASPETLQEIRRLLPHAQTESVPHESFKQLTGAAKAVIRSGEFTPYANVILVSGVTF